MLKLADLCPPLPAGSGLHARGAYRSGLGQYLSEDYTQQLDDARVLASVGSVGDAYDNAMAESFADSFKTELIRDRVWHTKSKLELAIVEWVAWF